jgi:hypothetical protein
VVRCWKNHVFAGNIVQAGGNYPDMLAWSSSATSLGGIPTEWVPTASNDARSIFLGDVGGVLDMIPLRDQLMVFSPTAMYSLTFTGGTFVFTLRKITESFGIAGLNCAVDIGGFLVVFTGNDVIQSDGQSFKSIASQQVQAYIRTLTSGQNNQRAFMFYNEEKADVYLCLSTTANGRQSCYCALVYNIRTGLWSFTNLVGDVADPDNGISYATYSTFANVIGSASMLGWETDIAGSGNWVTLQSGNTWLSGSPITGSVTRQDLDLGEPDAVKTVVRVDLNVACTSVTTFSVRVAGRFNEAENLIWSAPITVDITTNYQCPCFIVGRLISVEISCSIAGSEVHGFGLVLGDGSVY